MIALEYFLESDCWLVTTGKEVFVGLYYHTNGNPCAGCAKETECGVKVKLSKKEKVGRAAPTNAELAVKYCVSRRQIAKMRKRGEIN